MGEAILPASAFRLLVNKYTLSVLTVNYFLTFFSRLARSQHVVVRCTEENLPIGSGEIESAHRYIIQQRLKRPGAWWKPDNVDYMLALRVNRANRQWENYW